MGAIVKIEKGQVKLVNSSGGQVRAPFRPNDCGDAIFADINPNNGKIAVTSSKGKVWIYNENCGNLCNFAGNGTPIRAQWQGNDLVVYYSNGKVELRSDNGGYIRTI